MGDLLKYGYLIISGNDTVLFSSIARLATRINLSGVLIYIFFLDILNHYRVIKVN